MSIREIKVLKLIPIPALTLVLMLSFAAIINADIASTKHNLSLSGSFPVRSTNETRICIFCHTPHHALQSGVAGIDYPLWNHELSGQSYQVPNNTLPAWATLLSSPPTQPDGDSKLCLSCHDGTIAIASLNNFSGPPITMIGTGAGGVMPAGSSNLGTDISGHHPVSIAVNQPLIDDKWQQCLNLEVSMQLCVPGAVSPAKLKPTTSTYSASPGFNINGYASGVQCSSCHDPHTDPTPGLTFFLRAGSIISIDPLCSSCHVLCSGGCP